MSLRRPLATAMAGTTRATSPSVCRNTERKLHERRSKPRFYAVRSQKCRLLSRASHGISTGSFKIQYDDCGRHDLGRETICTSVAQAGMYASNAQDTEVTTMTRIPFVRLMDN
jgi:hypothetical protein